jgi:hypothetical protein
MDCFVAKAPLRKRFAFVAGNDDTTHLRILATRGARGLREFFTLKSEGVGNAGRRCTRSLVCKVESTRV